MRIYFTTVNNAPVILHVTSETIYGPNARFYLQDDELVVCHTKTAEEAMVTIPIQEYLETISPRFYMSELRLVRMNNRDQNKTRR